MKTILLLVALALVLAAVVFVVYGRERIWDSVAGPTDPGRYDFQTGDRSSSANDALACSIDLCRNPDLTLAVETDQPERVLERIIARLEADDPLARRVDDGSDPLYARFVTYSPVMRFPDAIDIETVALADDRTGIRAYARARIGRKDFGANLKRLEKLFSP